MAARPGSHPSNLHDNAYAVGTIDFIGDMPIILGSDGPSLGEGFVCPAVIARDGLQKMGQFKPGDTIRFHPVARPDDLIASASAHCPSDDSGSTVLARSKAGPVPVVYWRQGDDNLLVEYGDMSLDIALHSLHLLMQAVHADSRIAAIDLTPGIRSLQIHYDGTALPRGRLLGILAEIETSPPAAEDVVVPSRIAHLYSVLERPRHPAGCVEIPRTNAP